VIFALSNSGSIGGGNDGIFNGATGTITAGLRNSGNITGSIAGIDNAGLLTGEPALTNDAGGISGIVNSGTIIGAGEDGGIGILNENGGSIGFLTNTGLIADGEGAFGIDNDSATIGQVTNSGTISGSVGIWNQGSSSITALDNSGVIAGGEIGISNTGEGVIGQLVNSGTISGTEAAIDDAAGSLRTITNTGLISGNISIANSTLTVLGATGTSFGTISNGSYSIASGGTLVFGDGDEVMNQYIDGTSDGTLVKDGSGEADIIAGGTLAGGIDIFSGTLAVNGTVPLLGEITVTNGKLMGDGTVNGTVNVFDVLKPGNSPGYMEINATTTQQPGSTFEEDIGGPLQATPSTPVGVSGYYAYLNIGNGGAYVIDPGVTLAPELENLYSPSEPGFGSPTYQPTLGERFLVVTASGGVSGVFSTVVQPAGLAAGTQLVPLYDFGSVDDLWLATVQSSYVTIAPNQNAAAAGNVLNEIVAADMTAQDSPAEQALLDIASGKTAAQLPAFLDALDGQVHASGAGGGAGSRPAGR
jgi:hypothetical protein